MLKRYRFTIFLTVFGLFLCLFNLSGFDPRNLLFFSFSVPVWLVETVSDIHRVSLAPIYFLTVISYTMIGLYIDYALSKRDAPTSG